MGDSGPAFRILPIRFESIALRLGMATGSGIAAEPLVGGARGFFMESNRRRADAPSTTK